MNEVKSMAAHRQHLSCTAARSSIVATRRRRSLACIMLVAIYVTQHRASNRCIWGNHRYSVVVAGAAEPSASLSSKIELNDDAHWTSVCGTQLLPMQTIKSRTDGPTGGDSAAAGVFVSPVNPDVRAERKARLLAEPVKIGFNVYYDHSLAAQLGYNHGKVVKLVRNLLYEAQLYYEHQVMRQQVQINLIVQQIYSLKEIVGRGQTVNTVLANFGDTIANIAKYGSSQADMNMLLVFRNLWMPNSDGLLVKVHGVANQATFCRNPDNSLIAIQAYSSVAGHILAHEIAHTLNVLHDSDNRSPISMGCPTLSNLMSAQLSPDTLTWSECSIEQLLEYLIDDDIFRCTYDPARIARLKVVTPEFNWSPGSPNRNPLPGDDESLDQHCKVMYGDQAESTQGSLGFNQNPGGYETCQEAICRLVRPHFGELRISLGPAPTGSICGSRQSDKLGRCNNTVCQAS